MLHLPGLKITDEMERVFRSARDLRLAVRGLFGEGTDAIGDFFQVSNQTTLGQSEAQIIDVFGNDIIPRLVEYELAARDLLARERPYQLDDKDLALLRHAGQRPHHRHRGIVVPAFQRATGCADEAIQTRRTGYAQRAVPARAAGSPCRSATGGPLEAEQRSVARGRTSA